MAAEESTPHTGGEGAEDGKPDLEAAYVAPEKKSMAEIMAADEEDESLKRYKESLGLTASSGALNVIIHEMRITPQDGTDPIVIPLATPADVEAANALKLTVKQGVDFVVSIKYTVSGDVVLGLRFKHVVSRMGVNVSTDDVNLGGYPPKAEQYEYSFPADTWPSGMFARGTYSAVVTMTDDDDNEWAKFQYQFTIAKNWA